MTANKCLKIILSVIVTGSSMLANADESDDGPKWCKKAKTKVEKLICEEGQLLSYDEEVAAVYEHILKTLEAKSKNAFIRAQKEWISERELCGANSKTEESLISCVDTKIHKRSENLFKDLQDRTDKIRLQEFSKLNLKKFTNAKSGFEFQYPISWSLKNTKDGRINLKAQREEMDIGFVKSLRTAEKCTYSEEQTSPEEWKQFFTGKSQIAGHEFSEFNRGWLPSGHDRHFFGFFAGRCFAVDISDNSDSPSNCGRIDDGKGRAECDMNEIEAQDLMNYSNALINTLRFL